MDFVEELRWRGMLHDIMPGTQELLNKETVSAYVGIDPTADSLHVGHLVSVMMLRHLQHAGHKPIALIGGATGMVGDPSGKSDERNLLSEQELNHNVNCLKAQLSKFLDFDSTADNAAELVNNYDWFKEFNFLDFLREVGKHLTVNYMMSKDSVKSRLQGGNGISFTEFSYQLLQGYDFYYLYTNKNCKLQMGGSDQWGNIVTGTELIRRKTDGEAFALTCPLITKADGKKFGKTEQGNIWLDPKRTSPYKFYQFWLNVPDEEASKYIRIFTTLDQAAIAALEQAQAEAPHLRPLQKCLAEQVTVLVHSRNDYERAIHASQILFGDATESALRGLAESELLDIFDGVPLFQLSLAALQNGEVDMVSLLSEHTKIMPSKGEARKAIEANGMSINKQKISDTKAAITTEHLLNNKYILVQRGKKNYYLVICK
jgi:tyrosyl-tRNA synthetase